MLKLFASAILIAGLISVAGCGKPAGPVEGTKKEKEVEKEEDGHGWWCDEHGVKEADCSMCSAKVAKACRDKGDWCKDHNRAKSQCFICDPSLQAKFAGDYRAKFGKEPPDPTENKAEKK